MPTANGSGRRRAGVVRQLDSGRLKATNLMNLETKGGPANPYVLVALCSGASSTAIAFLALINFPRVTGSESMVWAITTMIATMVAAPAVMGIGIAYFMSKQPPRE